MDMKFYAGNIDKLKLVKTPAGISTITPFIVFQAGFDDGEEVDKGEEYISEIVESLEDKLGDVPYFITTMPISIYVVGE